MLAVAWLAAASAPAQAALTEGARLAAAYDAILNARVDRVDADLLAACPPAPAEACKALRAVALWWQILPDPDNRSLDARFNQAAAAAIAASDAWTRREPQRAEAWFYLAGSYAPLVQWRVTRGERLAAARDGNRIRGALERALELDPSLTDAYFGIGLYHYYADVAPAAAKVLRWLLFLPGGDRARGLQEMLQTRDRGQLLRGEADYQLHLLYLWYEQKPARALELLNGLDARYPSNPVFPQRIAEIHADYLHDHPSSAGAWRTLLDRARIGGVSRAALAEARARIGLAGELDAMDETDRAIELLLAVIDANAAEPYGARAEAELRLGAAYDRLGKRDAARAAYSAAVTHAPRDDPRAIRERTRAAERQRPDPSATEAYRLSLEGWRALERGAADEAWSKLTRGVTLAPANPVVRYRYARALAVRGDVNAAGGELDRVIATRPPAPAFVLASAYLAAARLAEQRGDRARALTLYRSAAQTRGGDLDARDQATRAVRRLTQSSTHDRFFDKIIAFVLDIRNFSTIIYIWYEGGQRMPPLVRSPDLALPQLSSAEPGIRNRRKVPGAWSADIG